MNPVIINQTPAVPASPATVNVQMPAPLSGRIEANISVGAILGHTILWVILAVITAGIALFFYPYSFAKLLINNCSVVDSYGRKSRMQCDLNVGDQIGHIIIWAIISVCTLGIGFFFYFFKVFNIAFNRTRIEP